jgi:Protein of unknown function (DUF3160)
LKGRSYLIATLVITLVFVAISSGCGGGAMPIKAVSLQSGGLQESFSLYYPVSYNAAGHVPPYQISPGLSNVSGMTGISLPSDAQAALAQKGFILMKGSEETLSAIYQKIPGAKFVTLDSLFYALRALSDYSMFFLEKESLGEDLKNLVSSLGSTLKSIYDGSQGTLREAAAKDLGFIDVAARLLDAQSPIVAEVGERVDKEVALIAGHQGTAVSPLFGFEEDYALYTPTGHYIGDAELERYYQAITWLSEVRFAPRPGTSAIEMLRGRNSTRQALLLVAALQAGSAGQDDLRLWDRIYQPSAFLTGIPGSLNVYTYGKIAVDKFGHDLQLSRLGDDEQIDSFIEAVLAQAALTSSAGSDEASQAFTLFAQRPDLTQKIFQKLVEPAVPDRTMPRSLDVAAAYGSERAFEIMDQLYRETQYESYVENIRVLRRDAYLNPLQTHESAYLSTLDSLRVFLKPPPDGYPAFMRNTAWQDRDVYSFLAGWSELEKGTLVWKKMDSPAPGLPAPPATTSKGYVEPRPESLALIAATLDMLKRGLNERGMATKEMNDRMDLLHELLLDFKGMAEKELNGQALSSDEYAEVAGFGDSLAYITTLPVPGEEQSSLRPSPALITDLYVDKTDQETLQGGLGTPNICYIVVPIDGKPSLAAGGGFSYYELVEPTDQKASDTSWSEAQSSGQLPAQPAWASSFLR